MVNVICKPSVRFGLHIDRQIKGKKPAGKWVDPWTKKSLQLSACRVSLGELPIFKNREKCL